MELRDFNALKRDEQIEAVWDLGVELCDRKEGHYLFILFSLDSFYVEFIYRDELLVTMRSFASTSLLEPYLNTIPLPHLYA